jgi:hypothetical protein
MIATSTSPTVLALVGRAFGWGARKCGRTFLELDGRPRARPATPDGDRLMVDQGGRCAAVSGSPDQLPHRTELRLGPGWKLLGDKRLRLRWHLGGTSCRPGQPHTSTGNQPSTQFQMGAPMTDATTPRRHPSRYGVWTRVAVTPQHAAEIENLGYSALWVGGAQPAQLRFAEPVTTWVH